ncbi:insulin-like growth factor-binding protein 2-B [Pholidichthys leucotaenia]
MILYFNYGLLFASLALPGVIGDLVFRCPRCTAVHMADCLEISEACAELVREPGCGCCPVCARTEGEPCGVYTPRCLTGLRCYPSVDAELPLQQLIQGLGRCGQKVDPGMDPYIAMAWGINEVHGTDNPTTRPPPDARLWQESARRHQLNERKTKMRTNEIQKGLQDESCLEEEHEHAKSPKVQQQQPGTDTTHNAALQSTSDGKEEEPDCSRSREAPDIFHTHNKPQPATSICQQELDKVLEEISKLTSEDNRGPLEKLYSLKFPSCDRRGLYNLKQCNMSTHGQRGECWCVDPLTGVQIPETPKVRGDPNCDQFREELSTTVAEFR